MSIFKTNRPWTETEENVLREMAAKGASALKIGPKIGRNSKAVKERALKLGLKLKPPVRYIFETRSRDRNPEVQ
jgi:hypothetical protein